MLLQIAAAWRDSDAAFPSAAGPSQPIKLPRQHNVDKDEYKEFLNLGHGEIFNLEVDRWANHSHLAHVNITTSYWRSKQALAPTSNLHIPIRANCLDTGPIMCC